MNFLNITFSEGQILIAFIILLVFLYNLFNRFLRFKKEQNELIKNLKREYEILDEQKNAILQKDLVEAKIKAQEWALMELEKYKKAEIERIQKFAEDTAVDSAINLLKKWKMEEEGRIRQDAINRSYAVNLGKISEHLVPFHGLFPFNPNDARFIGSPIDLLVFDGVSEERDEISIYFIEVKTGKSVLTASQKKIKKTVESLNSSLVKWLEIRPDTESFISDSNKPKNYEDKLKEIHESIRKKISQLRLNLSEESDDIPDE